LPLNFRALKSSPIEDFDRLLNEQAKRLQTEKIDFYLLHGLNRREWPKVRDLGVIKWAESAIANGRIGYLGFSFHDDYEVFQEIVDAYIIGRYARFNTIIWTRSFRQVHGDYVMLIIKD